MFLGNIFFSVNKFLIIFLPFILIFRNSAANIVSVYMGVSFLLYCLIKNNFSYYKNFIFFYFAIILLYLIINSFFSFNPAISIIPSIGYARIVLFIISLSFFFSEYNYIKKYLFFSFIACILLFFIDSLVQLLSGSNLLGMSGAESRMSSFFGRKLIMGSFVVRLLPLILAISFLLRIPHRNFVNLFITIISGILVLLSGERTSFLYYIFIILVYFYFNFNKKYFIYLIVLLFSFSVFTTAFNKKIIDRLFSHTLSQLTENNKFNYLSYRHTLHIETAYKMFLENKLLGHGLNSFRFLCSDKKYSVEDEIRNKNTFKSNLDGKFLIEKEKTAIETRYNLYIIDKDNFKQRIFDVHELVFMGQAQYFYLFVKDGDAVTKDQKIFSYFEIGNGCNTHPHNIYLEFLSELGLIGFAFFFLIFLYTSFHLLKFIFRHYTKKIYDYEKSLVLCLASIFISMFPLLPSGSYFNSWLMFISYLPIGLYLSILKKND